MVVAFEGNMFAVVFEPALVAFADDKDDMEAVRIPAVDCYGRFHCFRTIKNDPRIQIRIGDTVEHVLADVFDRLVIRVFEGENQMVDAILRGPDDSDLRSYALLPADPVTSVTSGSSLP